LEKAGFQPGLFPECITTAGKMPAFRNGLEAHPPVLMQTRHLSGHQGAPDEVTSTSTNSLSTTVPVAMTVVMPGAGVSGCTLKLIMVAAPSVTSSGR